MTTSDFDPVTGAKLKHLQCAGCEDFCTLTCIKCQNEDSTPCSNLCAGCQEVVVVMVAHGPVECEYHPGQWHDAAGSCVECERDGYDPEDA